MQGKSHTHSVLQSLGEVDEGGLELDERVGDAGFEVAQA